MLTEQSEQILVVRALRRSRIVHFSVPNGGKRDRGTAQSLRNAGLMPGVPDLLIVDPPPAFPEKVGCALELKREKGGRLSKDQEKWLAIFEARGWLTLVGHGHRQALQQLRLAGYEL